MLQPGVVYVVGYQTFAQGEPYAVGGGFADTTVLSYLSNATAVGGFGYPGQQATDSFGFGMPNMKIVSAP